MRRRAAKDLFVELIQVDPAWSPTVRGAQIGFGFFGVSLTAVTTLFALIEITTSPSLRTPAILWWSVGTLIEGGHLYRLARSPRGSSVGSWMTFAAALGLMIFNMWHVIQDPTARLLFSAAVAAGGLWLGAVRAMSLGLGAWASSRPGWAAALLVVSWAPLGVPAAIVVARMP